MDLLKLKKNCFHCWSQLDKFCIRLFKFQKLWLNKYWSIISRHDKVACIYLPVQPRVQLQSEAMILSRDIPEAIVWPASRWSRLSLVVSGQHERPIQYLLEGKSGSHHWGFLWKTKRCWGCFFPPQTEYWLAWSPGCQKWVLRTREQMSGTVAGKTVVLEGRQAE